MRRFRVSTKTGSSLHRMHLDSPHGASWPRRGSLESRRRISNTRRERLSIFQRQDRDFTGCISIFYTEHHESAERVWSLFAESWTHAEGVSAFHKDKFEPLQREPRVSAEKLWSRRRVESRVSSLETMQSLEAPCRVSSLYTETLLY